MQKCKAVIFLLMLRILCGKIVGELGYLALQLVHVNALEGFKRLLRVIKRLLIGVTRCADLLNLGNGLVIFIYSRIEVSLLIGWDLDAEFFQDFVYVFHRAILSA